MRTLLQDLRFAFRQFRKSPGFVITAILSLMLGIGATTAIFSVVYGVLLDPYPYKDNNRMVHVQLNDKGRLTEHSLARRCVPAAEQSAKPDRGSDTGFRECRFILAESF